jgi:hypothetical protein
MSYTTPINSLDVEKRLRGVVNSRMRMARVKDAGLREDCDQEALLAFYLSVNNNPQDIEGAINEAAKAVGRTIYRFVRDRPSNLVGGDSTLYLEGELVPAREVEDILKREEIAHTKKRKPAVYKNATLSVSRSGITIQVDSSSVTIPIRSFQRNLRTLGLLKYPSRHGGAGSINKGS